MPRSLHRAVVLLALVAPAPAAANAPTVAPAPAPAAAPAPVAAPAPPAAASAPAPDEELPEGPWKLAPPEVLPPYNARRARSLYNDKCRICHGADGLGEGAIARDQDPRVRDLTRGVYKFRSTPSGRLPTDRDLFDVLTRGLPGTAMIGFGGLSVEDRWQLVLITKAFCKRFAKEGPAPVVTPTRWPAPPANGPEARERLARGRAAWDKAQCAKCHGDDGRGWGEAARSQKDDQGHRIYPFDLTRGDNYRIGSGVEDVFRALFTGLDGTSMPSYEGALTEDEAWDLAYFVRVLATTGRVQ